MSEAEKMFPILGTGDYIPWKLIKQHEKQAERNHYQSLERLSERGGLSWNETLCVLEDKEFYRVQKDIVKSRVLDIVRKFEKVGDVIE